MLFSDVFCTVLFPDPVGVVSGRDCDIYHLANCISESWKQGENWVCGSCLNWQPITVCFQGIITKQMHDIVGRAWATACAGRGAVASCSYTQIALPEEMHSRCLVWPLSPPQSQMPIYAADWATLFAELLEKYLENTTPPCSLKLCYSRDTCKLLGSVICRSAYLQYDVCMHTYRQGSRSTCLCGACSGLPQ